MIEGVDMPTCADDIGGARDTRPRPCRLRTWCIDVDGHAGNCSEAPRGPHQPPDFGPKRKR